METTNETDARMAEVAETIRFTKMHYPMSRRPIRGTPDWRAMWVHGRTETHRFEALVFPEHAECPEFELGQSRISKVWVERLADQKTAANFDRGWDVRPTDETAKAIVDFLAAGLAEHVFGA